MRSIKQIVAGWVGAGDVAASSGGQVPPATSGSYGQLDLLDAMPAKARIDRYGALLSNDFLACETVKARAIRSLPVAVFKRADNGRVPAEGHPMSAVLHRPNALMSWGDLIAWAVIRRDVLGTAYVRVVRDPMRGTPRELRPVLAHVSVSFDKETGTAVYSAGKDYYNDAWACREDDLVAIKTDASEDGGRTGRSIVELAADDIGLSVDLVRFYRTVVENGNHFQGWLETDKSLDPGDVKAVRESLGDTSGPDEAGGIRVFDRGLKYHEVQLQLADMDIVAQERFVLEKVCRACHVDMHHVHADERAAAATTAAGSDIDFVKHTVLPEVTAIEQAFQPVLDRASSFGGEDCGYRIKLNVNGLLRGDFTTRMEGYRIGVYAGIFTRAYCATQEDVPWLPGQDRLLQPTAYYVLDEGGVPQLPEAATEGTAGQSDGVSGIDKKAVEDALRKLGPVIEDAGRRIEKRARADGDCAKTREFASQVMAPIELAVAHAGAYLATGELVDEAIRKGTAE